MDSWYTTDDPVEIPPAKKKEKRWPPRGRLAQSDESTSETAIWPHASSRQGSESQIIRQVNFKSGTKLYVRLLTADDKVYELRLPTVATLELESDKDVLESDKEELESNKKVLVSFPSKGSARPFVSIDPLTDDKPKMAVLKHRASGEEVTVVMSRDKDTCVSDFVDSKVPVRSRQVQERIWFLKVSREPHHNFRFHGHGFIEKEVDE